MRGRTYSLGLWLMLLLLAAPLSLRAGERYAVEIDTVPSAHSVEYLRYQQLLEESPFIQLTKFRRLRYSNRRDELAYSLKTGNSPDIIGMGTAQYERMADNGELLNLKPDLMLGQRFAWAPLKNVGALVSNELMRASGGIYAVPGRRRIHGLVVRRDLLEPGDAAEPVRMADVVRLSGELRSRLDGGAGLAVCLDAETYVYWSIAEYGCDRALLDDVEPDIQARQAMAVSAAETVLEGFSGMFREMPPPCMECMKGGSQASGETCEACGRALNEPLERVAFSCGSAQEAVAAFRDGKAAMAVCTRSDVLKLIDAGMNPARMMFVPLAGAQYVPDVELIGVYAGTVGRKGGVDRAATLVEFIKKYSNQYLVSREATTWLWYERALISRCVRRGYEQLFANAELNICAELIGTDKSRQSLVSDAMLGVEDAVLVGSFMELAGLEGWQEANYLAGLIADAGDDAAQGYLRAKSLRRARVPGRKASIVILLAVIAGLMWGAWLCFAGRARNRAFGAYTAGVPAWLAIIGLPLFVLLLAKVLLPALLGALSLAGVVTGNVPGSAASDCLARVIPVVGNTVFSVLVSVAVAIAISMAVARFLNRMSGWGVITGFALVLPVCFAGFAGCLLMDASADWLWKTLDAPMPGLKDMLMSLPAVWCMIPFASGAYLYRLRRIDRELYEAVTLDGGTPLDGFFAVTMPSLLSIALLHGLIVALLVMGSPSFGLLGRGDLNLGGALIRETLFEHDPALRMVTAVLLATSFFGAAALGVRKFSGIALRKIYGRGTL